MGRKRPAKGKGAGAPARKKKTDRELRAEARNAIRGDEDKPSTSLVTKSAPKKRKAPAESGEPLVKKAAKAMPNPKARATLSPVRRPKTPELTPDEGPRELWTAYDDLGREYFNSTWGTAFLPTRGNRPPYNTMSMWAEHPRVGQNSSLAPWLVKSIPINPPSERWMTRAHTDDLPLWHIMTIDQAPAPPPPMNKTPTKRPKPPAREETPKQPYEFHPHPESQSAQPPGASDAADPFVDATASQSTSAGPSAMPRPEPLPADTAMDPPQEALYDSWEDALDDVLQWAYDHGYALSISNSKGNKESKRRTIYLRCYKGGLLPEERRAGQAEDSDQDSGCESDGEGKDSKQKRERRSRMCRCPFKVVIRPEPKTVTTHRLIVENGKHEGHAMEPNIHLVRGNALTTVERDIIWQMSLKQPRSKPLDFLEQLNGRRRRLGQPELTRQGIIGNYLSRHKAELAAEKGALATALRQLEQQGEHGCCEIRRHRDVEGKLDGLYFTHKRIIPLLKHFGRVLAIDATYDMCQHKLKVVQFIAVLPMRTAMPIAFGLLDHENYEMYSWLLEHMKTVREPEVRFDVVVSDNDQALRSAIANVWQGSDALICHWHASQNVSAECTLLLGTRERRDEFMRDWRNLLDVESEREVAQLWTDFTTKWSQTQGGEVAVKYVDRCWRGPLEWNFISNSRTKGVKHFGVRTTSLVESAHSALKASMPALPGRRKYSIVNLIKTCMRFQDRRLNECTMRLTTEKDTLDWHRKDPLYEHVRGQVSYYAVRVRSKGWIAKESRAGGINSNLALALAQSMRRACTKDIPRPDLLEEIDASDFPTEACALSTTQCVPCRHRLTLLFAQQGVTQLALSDFDPFNVLPAYFADLPLEATPDSGLATTRTASDFVSRVQTKMGNFKQVLPNHNERIEAAATVYCSPLYSQHSQPSVFYGSPGDADVDGQVLTPDKRAPRKAKGHLKHTRIPTFNESVQKRFRKQAGIEKRRCGDCKQFGHRADQCQETEENKAELRAAYFEELHTASLEKKAKQQEEKEAQRKQKKEAKRRQEEARRRRASVDSDDTDPGVGLAEDQSGFDDPALQLCLRAEALRQQPTARPTARPATEPQRSSKTFRIPAFTASPASPASSHKSPSAPILPLPDDKGLDSTLVSSTVAEAAAAAITACDASLFSPTLPHPPRAATQPLPSKDLPGDSEMTQLYGEQVILSKDDATEVPGAIEIGSIDTGLALGSDASLAPDLQSLQASEHADVAIEGLLDLANSLQNPVQMRDDVEVREWAKLHIESDFPGAANGNCGYDVLKKLLGLKQPSQVRCKVWHHMQKPEARKALPTHNDDEWQDLLNHIFKDGVLPADLGRSMDKGCDPYYWYNDVLDPIVAHMEQRPIATASRRGMMQWRTVLPFELDDLSAPPKPPLCLLYSPGHWDGWVAKKDMPWPPVSLMLWGTKAKEYTETPTHKYIHRHYRFYHRGGAETRCGCWWTKTSAMIEENARRAANPVVVRSSEDELDKVLKAIPSSRKEDVAGSIRRSGRVAQVVKDKEEEAKKKAEEMRKKEEEEARKAREAQAAKETLQRALKATQVKIEGVKAPVAQMIQAGAIHAVRGAARSAARQKKKK